MATLREIRRRIGGVKSTQKITKAMKMVAAAKLRRAQDAVVSARPYARKMKELLQSITEKMCLLELEKILKDDDDSLTKESGP